MLSRANRARSFLFSFSSCRTCVGASRFYYLGNKFQIKNLTGAEVAKQLEKRKINDGAFTGRKILNELLAKEMASNTLSVEDASNLMSFQDLQRELQLRNIPVTGREPELRKNLLCALQKEESGTQQPPKQYQKVTDSSFQIKEPVEKKMQEPQFSSAYAQNNLFEDLGSPKADNKGDSEKFKDLFSFPETKVQEEIQPKNTELGPNINQIQSEDKSKVQLDTAQSSLQENSCQNDKHKTLESNHTAFGRYEDITSSKPKESVDELDDRQNIWENDDSANDSLDTKRLTIIIAGTVCTCYILSEIIGSVA